jgi:hypothetical protein
VQTVSWQPPVKFPSAKYMKASSLLDLSRKKKKEGRQEAQQVLSRLPRAQDTLLVRPGYLQQEPLQALFTSRVFEGMGGNYFVSRNFPDRLFTSSGFEGIIPRYPHNSPPL